MPLGTILNAYLRDFIRSKEIHFSITPKMTSYLEKILGKAETDLKNNINVSPIFSSAEEMDVYLDS